ncbi:hypothetical protein [Paenibacillus thiaminolyticus]|uniref:hypothetical protein n=1 Tax=Paenibacillus thiaminolyticus TaxID=49283 RepID=UPI002542FAD0|nr:hypothetical protein [Paenibacillus thiaminolyticus]WII38264.1 hypothetical protein O0V01_03740 [Paenibacillus thiaminolyticus]
MTLFKHKLFLVPVLLVAMLMFFTLPTPSTHAANNTVLDTDGNPVIAGQKYIVSVIDSNNNYSDRYWSLSSIINGQWVGLSTSMENASFYTFDGTGVIYENEVHKIIENEYGRYLYYQAATAFYPKGGIYFGQETGSINFTLIKSTEKGYHLIADDGPLFADQGNTSSMVTSSAAGNDFTVEFIKQP